MIGGTHVRPLLGWLRHPLSCWYAWNISLIQSKTRNMAYLPSPNCDKCGAALEVKKRTGPCSAVFSCPRGCTGNQDAYVSFCYKRSCRAPVDSRKCSFDSHSRSFECLNGHSFNRRRKSRRRTRESRNSSSESHPLGSPRDRKKWLLQNAT
jgi:hypothetical protein